LKKITRKIK